MATSEYLRGICKFSFLVPKRMESARKEDGDLNIEATMSRSIGFES